MFSTAAIMNPSGKQPHVHPVTSSHWFFPHPVAWLLAGLLVVADMLLVGLLDLQVTGFHQLLNTNRLWHLGLLGIVLLLLWRLRVRLKIKSLKMQLLPGTSLAFGWRR